MCLIINPLPSEEADIERAKDLCSDVVAFGLGSSYHFPEATEQEMRNAAAAVRVFNQQRMYGAAVVLWPSDRVITSLLTSYMAGDFGERMDMPPLKLRYDKELKQLYLDY